MQTILEKIKNADHDQIIEIMQAISQWYAASYPDWDVVYIAMPKDPKQRRISVEGISKNLEKELQWYEEQWNKKDSLG